jgi:Glycosyl Hydrolase Family 88.
MTLEDAYFASIGKIKHNSLRIGKSFPHVAIKENGQYNSERPSCWTSGFWPGLLWLSYLETGDEMLENLAMDIESFQDGTMAEFDLLHHDVGFQWIPMALADYRITGSEESRRRAIRAAILLSSRFNPAGGYLRAWNDGKEGKRDSSGWAIIDCLMNIPILFWASKENNDPRFFNIAVVHADTMLKYAVRENGSAAHITMFDSKSGAFLGHGRGQGLSPDSSWSRGQG